MKMSKIYSTWNTSMFELMKVLSLEHVDEVLLKS